MHKNKNLIYIGIIILAVLTGMFVSLVVRRNQTQEPVEEEEVVEILPEVDQSVTVTAAQSKTADNTVTISVKGLANKYSAVAYEVTYESGGLIKGVNSGSKPIDVTGKDAFEREVYLGTCSRNVCKPDAGVTAVSVVLEFTDAAGLRSQFNQEFGL